MNSSTSAFVIIFRADSSMPIASDRIWTELFCRSAILRPSFHTVFEECLLMERPYVKFNKAFSCPKRILVGFLWIYVSSGRSIKAHSCSEPINCICIMLFIDAVSFCSYLSIHVSMFLYSLSDINMDY